MSKSQASHCLAVIGGQWGSEGKGNIVAHLANEYDVHIRVGGPNAGHTIYYEGKSYKMQQIPCGWVNPDAKLIIGRGALIDINKLHEELCIIEKVMPGIYNRVFVDADAMVIDSRHKRMSEDAGRTARLGSTGEGVGSARVARILRDPSMIRSFEDSFNLLSVMGGINYTMMAELFATVCHIDTPSLIRKFTSEGLDILLEGTQGSGLSVIHGPWPYGTNHDTGAAQMAADAGIPPHHIDDVIMVVRTYPIRVAGNSGPLPKEISWKDLSRRLNKPVVEKTTVTKKIRRVAEWDYEVVDRAVVLNDPSCIALNFLDYINPKDEGKTDINDISEESLFFTHLIEQRYNVPVTLLGTGGPNHIIDRRFS